jgi:hypothetical protein
MPFRRPRLRSPLFPALSFAALLTALPAAAGTLVVDSVTPSRHALTASRTTTVAVLFDRAVDPATVTAASFKVAGESSGPASGTFQFGMAGRLVTLAPDAPFAAGETVFVNLSEALAALDGSPFRAGGFAYSFWTAAGTAPRTFTPIETISVRSDPDEATRAYGGFAADLDEDGWVDLGIVNEISADLRVLLNLADGTGRFADFLEPPAAVGDVASPNEAADFDGDGHVDAATANAGEASVSVVLGNGDGTFGAEQVLAVGNVPHGLATLDVDGDGDLDLVSANTQGNNLTLLVNDGSGVFGAGGSFDGGGSGEYGLAAGDMDHDGIFDLVVGTRNDQDVHVLRGNGDGTFTLIETQDAGGLVWMIVLGDVDGDGDLDVASANGETAVAALLRGDGAGNLAAPVTEPLSGSAVATDLGDLDGDGDLDWVVSSFGGGRWHLFANDGGGGFTEDPEILATANASCTLMLDVDRDDDLDLALVDEVADEVQLFRNGALLFADGFESGDTTAWSATVP